jgi:3-oxoacyl-[acyl-carrier-protein] synthase-3
MTTDVYITGLGSCYPNAPVANDAIETVLGKINGEPSWAKDLVLQSCGITSRHYAINPQTGEATHSNAQITAAAVEQAARDGHYSLQDLDLLACGTSSPDQLNPGHACMVQGELHNRPLEAVSFSGFCAAGLAALRYAYLSVKTGERALAAATGSEIASAALRAERFHLPLPSATQSQLLASPILSMNKEFLRWILADGAGCALLAGTPSSQGISLRIDWIEGVSLAHEYPACMYAGATKERKTGKLTGWLQMRDLEKALRDNVFCLTQDVELLKRSIVAAGINGVFAELVRRRGLHGDDFAWFLPHLSSFFFREPLARAMAEVGCEIPAERWFTNLDRVGNLGSAALFAILDEGKRTGRFQPGQRILCGVPESGRFSFYFLQLTAV